MKVAVFSSKPYVCSAFTRANKAFGHDLHFLEPRLCEETAALAAGFPAVCVFVNDQADRPVLEILHDLGVGLLTLRCAGFNNVDIHTATELDITVARVASYSPYAVAEHAVGLMMALNRKIHRAYARVREGNFELEGLLGFDLHGRTVGVVGVGKVGAAVARILHGFGCRVLAFDRYENDHLASIVEYVPWDTLLTDSDIITLHCPLTPQTQYLIDEEALARMREGVMLINTSRGGLIDTSAAIEALKSGKLAYLGMDVYEEEQDLFFEDLSDQMIHDDIFARLLTFPNVIITGHQGFFTREALSAIATTTLTNVADFAAGRRPTNVVTGELVT